MTALPTSAATQGPCMKRLQLRSAVSWGAVALLLVVAWREALVAMAARWMPLIGHTNLPWSERLVGGDSYYHHGPAVVGVSVVMAVIAWRRSGNRCERSRNASRWGEVLGVLALLLHLMGMSAGVGFVSGYALVLAIAAVLLVAGGWPMWRVYARPVLLLLFAVPLPLFAVTLLTFPLKQFAAQAAVVVAGVAGVDARVVGSAVAFTLHDGEPAALKIADTCSGLRSLLTLVWLVGFYVAAARYRWRTSAVLITLALPLAVLFNALRVAALIVLAHRLGPGAVEPDTALHQWAGLLAFAGAIGVVFVFDVLVRRRRTSTQTQVRTTSLSPRLPRSVWVGLGLLAAASLLTHNTPTAAHAAPVAPVATERLPDRIIVAGQAYTARDLEVGDELRDQLGGAEVIHRRYINAGQTSCIDLVIVAHATDRSAIHPPEVCLRGIGATIEQADTGELLTADGSTLPARRLTTKTGDIAAAHVYSYHTAEGWTTHYLTQQSRMWLSTLTSGTGKADANNAVVRITVPDTQGDPYAAALIADAAAAQLMPAAGDALRD